VNDSQNPSKNIGRHEFEIVIRRAAELAMREGESEEQLSEDEVLRIGSELGLSARHVQQALYELPELESEPSALSGYYGPSVVVSSRVIPGDADHTIRRLEDYLSTREYLQLVRRKHGRLVFQPAEDTISLLARGLLRPSSRFQLARSRRVVLTARPLEEGRSHVQIATDMGEQRTSAIRTGVIAGSFCGLAAGLTGAATLVFTMDPGIATAASAIASVVGGTAGGLWIGIKATASSFRNRIGVARQELEACSTARSAATASSRRPRRGAAASSSRCSARAATAAVDPTSPSAVPSTPFFQVGEGGGEGEGAPAHRSASLSIRCGTRHTAHITTASSTVPRIHEGDIDATDSSGCRSGLWTDGQWNRRDRGEGGIRDARARSR
jgi:hypothetical protein